ncbi:hypothetical protein B7P43_G09135 [Cryptotermes secundus]|uniref:Uncharacterized protein n=1 Tax=Cryptotermes secundus TaxID=105785 RepID=A0A2J7Q3D2_9NEOP|nr:hypothetical protein B7P43_G09135 [Cryptotermes secundus]
MIQVSDAIPRMGLPRSLYSYLASSAYHQSGRKEISRKRSHIATISVILFDRYGTTFIYFRSLQ